MLVLEGSDLGKLDDQRLRWSTGSAIAWPDRADIGLVMAPTSATIGREVGKPGGE
jgi:hypothetical protein